MIKRNLRSLILSCLVWMVISTAYVAQSVTPHSDSPSVAPVAPIIAPPPPVISDEERRRELANRRTAVAAKIGTAGVLLLFSAEPRVYSNDVDYSYRQENNFFYLTGLNQAGSKLLLMPGETAPFREILFLPRRNARAETWTGRMYSAEDARRISGIEEIWDAQEYDNFIQELHRNHSYRPAKEKILSTSSIQGDRGASNRDQGATADSPLITAAKAGRADLYLLVPGQKESREFRQEQQFVAQWTETASGFVIRSAWPVFSAMRMSKSDVEQKYLQHAIDITAEAISRAMTMANRAQWEYEVQAEVEYTFRRRNADYWGYPSIVGCGANSTTLHYEEAQGKVAKGSLVLMDVGAEYQHYSADVTRTFPIDDRFTPAQADIYNTVYEAQEAAIEAVKSGVYLSEIHNIAVDKIKESLLRLGLITDKSSDQYRIWFMHGTSHHLGMNVHDVNVAGQKLTTGMVFTIEPGIYIREDALDNLPKNSANEKFIQTIRSAFEKYKNIGVRIEDDVVVTETGYRVMSSVLPRSLAEVERFIEQARREVSLK